MNRLPHNRLLILVAVAALTLAAVLFGGRTLAQESSERLPEGTYGDTGQRLNMTPEEAEAMLLDETDVVYHFAGGLNNTVTAVHRATVVQCSNVSATETTRLELQLFEYNANSVYTGTIPVGPLNTATFESSAVDFYSADVVMNAGFVEQGYGRILSDHDEIICTVQTLDPDNTPPTWIVNIPLYVDPLANVFLPSVQNDS